MIPNDISVFILYLLFVGFEMFHIVSNCESQRKILYMREGGSCVNE